MVLSALGGAEWGKRPFILGVAIVSEMEEAGRRIGPHHRHHPPTAHPLKRGASITISACWPGRRMWRNWGDRVSKIRGGDLRADFAYMVILIMAIFVIAMCVGFLRAM